MPAAGRRADESHRDGTKQLAGRGSGSPVNQRHGRAMEGTVPAQLHWELCAPSLLAGCRGSSQTPGQGGSRVTQKTTNTSWPQEPLQPGRLPNGNVRAQGRRGQGEGRVRAGRCAHVGLSLPRAGDCKALFALHKATSAQQIIPTAAPSCPRQARQAWPAAPPLLLAGGGGGSSVAHSCSQLCQTPPGSSRLHQRSCLPWWREDAFGLDRQMLQLSKESQTKCNRQGWGLFSPAD